VPELTTSISEVGGGTTRAKQASSRSTIFIVIKDLD